MSINLYYDKQKQKWRVEIRARGARVRRFFDVRATAERFVKWAKVLVSHGGDEYSKVEPNRVMRLVNAEDRLGVPIENAVDFYLKHHKEKSELLISDAILDFIKIKELQDLSKVYLRTLGFILGILNKHFGDKKVGQVDTAQLSSKAYSYSENNESVKDVIVVWKSFFRWLERESHIDHNPALRIPIPKVKRKEPAFMSAEDTTNLFDFLANNHPQVIPYMALKAFAGLRTATAKKMTWDLISLEDEVIRIPASIDKSYGNIIEDLPRNLWKWLNEYSSQPMWLSRRRTGQLILKATKRLGIDVPKNAWRHSFATYHVALYRDASATAMTLGHSRDPSVLYRNYRGLATRSDGKAYFTIYPPSRS